MEIVSVTPEVGQTGLSNLSLQGESPSKALQRSQTQGEDRISPYMYVSYDFLSGHSYSTQEMSTT